MSFLENIAKAVTGFTGLFNAASSLFNVLGGFFGNNSANPLDAGQAGSLLTQSTTPNNPEDLRTTTDEEREVLNRLYGNQALLNAEQQQVPQTT